MQDQNVPIVVCALYKFTDLGHYRALRDPIHQRMSSLDILGTLLLAKEGINGTLAGLPQNMDTFLGWLMQQPGLKGLDVKESLTDKPPFKRARVKLKKEIVSMGVQGIDPRHSVGTYVDPADWNDLIDDPDVILIDTRNDYEVQVGRFENAIDPHTATFREFPEYVRQNLDPQKHKKVAMYCTGGIRCEKSTALLKQQGFDEVYHLKGGILKYLETVPKAESKWQGECFVFDDRVTVNHQLEKGSYDQCHACRLPITDKDKLSAEYQPGVSCPRCFGERTDEDRARYAERQKQIKLARERGQEHIGPQPGLK
jgi:UPF0176 protein